MKTHKTPLRRVLGLILCLSMLASLALPALGAAPVTETPATPTAQSAFDFNASTGTIDGYTGSDTDVVIPASIDGVTVKALNQVFTGSAVTSVVIPSTVKTIYEYEFDLCDSLTDLYFYGEVPTNLWQIVNYDSKDFTVHCKAKYQSAFESELEDYDGGYVVPISANISNDLADPAYPSHNLKYTDNGDGTHSAVCTDEGCSYTITNEAHKYVGAVCACGAKLDGNDPKYFNFEIREDGKAWLLGYTGPGGDITIPATYTDGDGKTYDVVGVHSRAFCGYNAGYDYDGQTPAAVVETITGITVPASVTTVEACAFAYVGRLQTRNWSLTKLVFEADDVVFGTSALAGNPNLTTVTLPAQQTAISSSLLSSNTSLAEITIPATVTEVGANAFRGDTALRKVNFLGTTPPLMTADSSTPTSGTQYPFAGCTSLLLSVPAAQLSAYQEAWSAMLSAGQSCAGDITLVGDGTEDPEVASIPDFNIYVNDTTAESEQPQYITYHVTDFDNATKSGKVEVKYVGFNGGGTLTIPETVTSKVAGKDWTFTVTGIGVQAMMTYEMVGASSNYWFTKVEFPSTLEYISASGCRSLERVTELDFSNTKLHTIGESAFYGCNAVKTVKLPATLEKMGAESSVEVGDDDNKETLTYTENVFACCDALENIFVDENNPNFKDIDGILFTKNGKKLIRYPNARPATHYDIPAGVEVIGCQAFMQSYKGKSVLETVSFPDSVKLIESLAFRQSSLTEVTLPVNATFGTCAFDICKKLTKVTIPEGVTALSDYMFWSCENLAEISCPDSLKTIGDSCFGHTGLAKVDLNKVETIGGYAFYYNKNLTEITIPATVTKIGTAAFCNNGNLAKAVFEEGAKTVGAYMFFDDYALSDLRLVDSIETIGDAAFGYCVALKSVTLPKSLKTMGGGVFYKCWKNLYKVIIPDEAQITKLPANTFESCQALTYLYLGQNITATGPVSLYDTNANLVVDIACVEDSFNRSKFDVYPYDLDDKTLFAKYEETGEFDDNGYPVYKVWVTQEGADGGCCGGGSAETDGDYYVVYFSAGANPTFQYGSVVPAEPVVLTVYEQYEDENVTSVKTYTASDLDALAKKGVVGYQFWSMTSGEEKTVAANEYVTIADLLADAGLDFAEGDTISAAASDGAAAGMSFADSNTCKYYIDDETKEKTEVPAAILLFWNSGAGSAEEVAKTAYRSGNLRFAYGITEEQYGTVHGRRLASGITSITVVHPARTVLTVLEKTEGSDAVTVKSYKIADLAALKTEGTIGYQFWKTGSDVEQTMAATEYVTIENLLADAGVDFAAGDTVSASDPTGFASNLTYEDMGVYKYYCTKDGATEVPAALALSWATGTGDLASVAAKAENTGNIRFGYGISEAQYEAKNVGGKRLVSKIATVTVTHPAPTVLTVLEKTEGSDAVTAKSYTAAELDALKTEGTIGYQFWKTGSDVEQTMAATEYVTIENLLADAGVDFAAGDTVSASDPTGFASNLTYEDMGVYKYYCTKDGATEVPAALALSWATGTGDLASVAAKAENTGNIRFGYGISEAQYEAKNVGGKRLVSKIATVTVTHAAPCKHETTELRNAVLATCTTDGYTGDVVCTNCGATVKTGEKVPAFGCPGADFTDMPVVTYWSHNALDYALQNSLLYGTSATTIAPQANTTRAMLVSILYRQEGKPAVQAAASFTDVAENMWYADAVAWAAENGIVYGVTEDKFDPNGNLTREQIAAILYRYAGFKGRDTAARADLASFPDADAVSSYAKDAMSWAVAENILAGSKTSDGTTYLQPRNTATREQVAQLMMQYIEAGK